MEENNNMQESKEIVEVKGSIESQNIENSQIKIANDVIATIAGLEVSKIPGVAGMAAGFAGGISEVFSGKKSLSKGIKVEAGEKQTKIDVSIIVEYGTRIPDVAFEIQNRVKKAVEAMTGLQVESVNVSVQGIKTVEAIKEETKVIQD